MASKVIPGNQDKLMESLALESFTTLLVDLGWSMVQLKLSEPLWKGKVALGKFIIKTVNITLVFKANAFIFYVPENTCLQRSGLCSIEELRCRQQTLSACRCIADRHGRGHLR